MPREMKTGAMLIKLQNVKNARDLAEACPNIRPGKANAPASRCCASHRCGIRLSYDCTLRSAGLLFRSACPNSASPEDVELLRETLKIRQLVRHRRRPIAVCNDLVCKSCKAACMFGHACGSTGGCSCHEILSRTWYPVMLPARWTCGRQSSGQRMGTACCWSMRRSGAP